MTAVVYLPLLGQLNKRQYPVTQDQFNSLLGAYGTVIVSPAMLAATLANYSLVITPERFGAKGDGTTDDTAAFAALATYVNASAPDATISFKPGANYAVWPADPGNVYLMNFTGTNGLTINFNGAKITTAMLTTSSQQYVIGFNGTNNNITINDPHYEQTVFGNITPTFTGGAYLILISDNAINFIINNLYEVGGLAGLGVIRQSTNTRASNIVMNGGYFSSVFYPLSFQKNGDNFTGTGIYGTNVGRMYFPYNVKHHNVSFLCDYVAIVLPTILIKLYADNMESTDLNTLADIKINAQFTSNAVLSNGLQYAEIQFQQQTSTTASGTIKDIDLHIEAVANSPGVSSIAFDIAKVTSVGAADSTTRGYLLDNIILAGRFDFGAGNVQAISAFNTVTDGTWTGETVRNIIFRGLIAVNSTATDSIVMNVTGLAGPISFENITVDKPIALTGAGANVVSRNVSAPSGLAASQQGPTVLNGTLTMGAYAYANLPSLLSGMTTVITDSPTNALGATITVGGGGNTVLAWYGNGRWTVIGT